MDTQHWKVMPGMALHEIHGCGQSKQLMLNESSEKAEIEGASCQNGKI